MRISDWSSDVCSSDLRHGILAVQSLPADDGAGERRLRTAAGARGEQGGSSRAGRRAARQGRPRRPRPSLPFGTLRRSAAARGNCRSEEHTSELQSLMRISYAVFCLKKKKTTNTLEPTK